MNQHSKPRRVGAALAALLIGGTLFATMSEPASATPGQLSYDGCLANDASQGCVDVPFAPLSFARGVATSSDGKSVYAVSSSGSIAHFLRGGPDGQLTFDGCFANNASEGCVDLPAAPLGGAIGVAVSPDGTSVYVVSANVNTISQFRRDSNGRLTYDGCLGNNDAQLCDDVPFDPLTRASGVAVSPDGQSVYVASAGANSVSQFVRNATNGKLSYTGCLANDPSQGCADLPFAPLAGARGVTVSPDGKSVYVAATGAGVTVGSLAHFFRSGPGGALSYDGCLANDASQGCVDLPFSPIGGATSVAVSPDNKSVYVAAESTDAVAHFFRNTVGGQVSYDGCLGNDGSQGCLDLPFAPLDQARGVTVSPDGKSVYVASASGSITHLFRNGPGGQIGFDRCLANDGGQGCVDLPFAPLAGATGVAVSPDGESVYVGSDVSNSVAHFFRSNPPGQISLNNCLADDASQGCVGLPLAPLTGAFGVAASSDGKSVYVASSVANSVTHFVRNGSTGQLGFDGCLADDTSQGCGNLPASPLSGASGVAVSPDGASVYIASANANSISQFRRDANGRLTYDGCLANTDLNGCVDLPFDPLHGAKGVTVSPDGGSVYVVNGGAISHFFRDTTTGRLTYNACLADTSSQGCVDLPGTPLGGSIMVTVSPDGKSVYVGSAGAGSFNGTVTQFIRGSVGQLAFDGCFGNDASQGCVDLPGTPLTGTTGVVVSPDGKSVYAASTASGVAHFFRNPVGGRLAFDGCLGNDASQGCGDLPFAPLRGAFGVAVSPDGTSVYTASFLSASIAHFFINGPAGQISFDNCLSSIPDDNCRDLPLKPLNGARGVVVSPDGSSVYVVSREANSIAHFRR